MSLKDVWSPLLNIYRTLFQPDMTIFIIQELIRELFVSSHFYLSDSRSYIPPGIQPIIVVYAWSNFNLYFWISQTFLARYAFYLTFIFCFILEGNQYTYQGNTHNKAITQGNSVEENITRIIKNQEEGRCPIEFTNVLSRAKVVEMKGIKPNEKTRSFTGLYQDS